MQKEYLIVSLLLQTTRCRAQILRDKIVRSLGVRERSVNYSRNKQFPINADNLPNFVSRLIATRVASGSQRKMCAFNLERSDAHFLKLIYFMCDFLLLYGGGYCLLSGNITMRKPCTKDIKAILLCESLRT